MLFLYDETTYESDRNTITFITFIHIQNQEIFDNSNISGNASTIPADFVSTKNVEMVCF